MHALPVVFVLASTGLLAPQGGRGSAAVTAQGDGQTVNVEALREFAARARTKAEADKREAEAWARETGWPVHSTLANGSVIELMSVEDGHPSYVTTFNHFSADSIGTDELWPGGSAGLGLRGTGVVLGLWDAGSVRETHNELSPRVNVIDGPHPQMDAHDHATHVAGTMVGAGNEPEAAGMAPGALLKCRDLFNDLYEMGTQASGSTPYPCSNHSYGELVGWYQNKLGYWVWNGDASPGVNEAPGFGQYGQHGHGYDVIAFDAPDYLICVAAGNDRGEEPGPQPVAHWHYPNDPLTTPPENDTHQADGGLTGYDSLADGPNGGGCAKNVLTVGAVKGVTGGWHQGAQYEPTVFSAWGPTDDGRIKPDVCAVGWQVYSCIAKPDAFTGLDDYAKSNGTSMASPAVCGSMALLVELWRSTHPGTSPRSATLKALAIHGAHDEGLPGPDYSYGWGVFDAREAANLIRLDASQSSTVVEARVEGEFLPWRQRILVNGTEPLRVTIVWTDPPGMAVAYNVIDSTSSVLVNDLDLRVGAPSGVLHLPWILDPALPHVAATTGDNVRDNVEQVFVASPPVGEYTIEVAYKLGVFPQPPPQDFSVVISGATKLGKTSHIAVNSLGKTAGSLLADPAMSPDGQYVVFDNASADLVPGDTNNLSDLFVHDRWAGGVVRVNVSSAGAQANANIIPYTGYSISADGHCVVFVSDASNLVPGDTNAVGDIFVHDRDPDGNGVFDEGYNTTTRVSVSFAGAQATHASFWPSISGDGRYVAFSGDATLISPGSQGQQVYVHDRQTGVLVPVCVKPDGTLAYSTGSVGVISTNGLFVAFKSDATNLVAGSFGGGLFVRDLQANTTIRVNVRFDGSVAYSCTHPSISADGRYVAFISSDSTLLPFDANGTLNDVFVRDLQSGITTYAGLSATGAQPSDASTVFPVISTDGRYVTFTSSSSQLVPGDTNLKTDVFMRDRDPDGNGVFEQGNGTTVRVSVSSTGLQGQYHATSDFQSRGCPVSADGRYVAFVSQAALVPGLVGGARPYVHDLLLTSALPTTSSLCAGDTLAQNAGFHHDLSVAYQWRRDGTDLSGATDPLNHTVYGATGADCGTYDVAVIDATHSVQGVPVRVASLPAQVVVRTPLGFWLQPQGGWARRHGTREFSAGPTGWPVEQWQWSKDGVSIPGATLPTLTLSNIQLSDAGSYTVTISNSCGSATSAPAQLQVIDVSRTNFVLPPNFIDDVL